MEFHPCLVCMSSCNHMDSCSIEPGHVHTCNRRAARTTAFLPGTPNRTLTWTPATDRHPIMVAISRQEQAGAAPGGSEGSESTVCAALSAAEVYVLDALVRGCMPGMYGFPVMFQDPSTGVSFQAHPPR